ncbi:hypothetical protein RRG08_016369 [Elysia crispata]|uniref:Uncharacterized protein n=1 Tax=Elysia crispata TaxID=231223 RepID=A0AAE1AEM5_9GAST|nr:hypothetical protein RRG08_016369 [Elysia crispata]
MPQSVSKKSPATSLRDKNPPVPSPRQKSSLPQAYQRKVPYQNPTSKNPVPQVCGTHIKACPVAAALIESDQMRKDLATILEGDTVSANWTPEAPAAHPISSV